MGNALLFLLSVYLSHLFDTMAYIWSLFKFIKSYYTASLVPPHQQQQQQTEDNVSLTLMPLTLKNQMLTNRPIHAAANKMTSKNQLVSQMNMITSFSPIHLDYKLSHNS
jgi:hypothetical protein